MEEEKEFMKDILNMLLWQYKMYQYHTELQDISHGLQSIFNHPKLQGHCVKQDILQIQVKLDAVLENLKP